MKYSYSEIRIPEDIASEVLTLASQYYAEQNQGYNLPELQIPPKLIELAVLEVQARHQQKLEQQKKNKQYRQIFLTISVFVAIAIAWGAIETYNNLSYSRSQPLAAWAQVENQLQRRADLIPSLVRVTQTYARHEKEIISLLNKSRQAYLQANTQKEKLQALALVEGAINNFQNYAATDSHLQASQLFINLHITSGCKLSV
jgi:LemA protein